VVVGLTANFLPQVLGDNRILLQYQLTSSSLAGMSTVSSGNSSIQTPTVASQSLQQQAFVRDGEAIVLFGLEQNASSVTGSQSIPVNVGRDASKSRTLRVIMLQVFGGGESAGI
jgi:type II secretory pathway component HofQ